MNSKYKDLIEQFIKIQRNSENTTESYRGDLNQFIRWVQSKGYKLESITTQELATYQDVFDEKGYKETTINRKLSSLTGFIKYLKDIGLADGNLKNIIQIKDIPYRESTFMQREEVDLLIKGINEEAGRYDIHKERDDLILKLFLYTGLRLSELRNIDINDFKKIVVRTGRINTSSVMRVFDFQREIYEDYGFL